MPGSGDESMPSADASAELSTDSSSEGKEDGSAELEPSDELAAASKAPAGRRTLAGALGYVLLGALLGAMGANAFRKPPPPGRHFWNFDDESMTDGTLRDGWSNNERDSSGLTFRWCTAVRCTLRLPVSADILGQKVELLLRARMWPFRYPGVKVPQKVRLLINAEVVGEQALGDTISTVTFRVRPGLFVSGRNDVAMEFTYAKSPKETGTNERDERLLAAAVDWIELDPLR
jgi:hypothetical protein